MVFKTFQQLPFSPRVKPVSVLWPAPAPEVAPGSVHRRLGCSPLASSPPARWPACWSWSTPDQGLCSSWMFTPSSSCLTQTPHPPSPHTTRLSLTICLRLWFPASVLHVLPSASLFSIAIPRTTNVITISHTISLVYYVYYLLPSLEYRSLEDSRDICLFRVVPSMY